MKRLLKIIEHHKCYGLALCGAALFALTPPMVAHAADQAVAPSAQVAQVAPASVAASQSAAQNGAIDGDAGDDWDSLDNFWDDLFWEDSDGTYGQGPKAWDLPPAPPPMHDGKNGHQDKRADSRNAVNAPHAPLSPDAPQVAAPKMPTSGSGGGDPDFDKLAHKDKGVIREFCDKMLGGDEQGQKSSDGNADKRRFMPFDGHGQSSSDEGDLARKDRFANLPPALRADIEKRREALRQELQSLSPQERAAKLRQMRADFRAHIEQGKAARRANLDAQWDKATPEERKTFCAHVSDRCAILVPGKTDDACKLAKEKCQGE